MNNSEEALGHNPMGEAKNLIATSKNIYLIASQEPEAMACTMALFYTLKYLDKNVNVVMEELPEKLKFLSPSIDFISHPKNFVISIPGSIAKISQVHYEKNDDFLKIHLMLESGNIKKDNISFYFEEAKPDLVITIGIQDYQKELSRNLDSLGFLLDCQVLNIDNMQENKKFGKINIVTEGSLAEIIFDIDKTIDKEFAECLLTGLIIHTNNFTNNQTPEIFQLASTLMKAGADLKVITDNLKSEARNQKSETN